MNLFRELNLQNTINFRNVILYSGMDCTHKPWILWNWWWVMSHIDCLTFELGDERTAW